MYLEPVNATSTRFVVASLALHHLDHETFTSILHAHIQERLYLLDGLVVHGFGEVKLSLNGLEVLPEKFASFR